MFMQSGSCGGVDDEDNVAHAARGGKGKAKKEGPIGGGKTHEHGKKKETNMSKVKCWNQGCRSFPTPHGPDLGTSLRAGSAPNRGRNRGSKFRKLAPGLKK